ncbi:MAG TPA: hypothetical protein VKU36_04355 [Candidatus Babeliales bacterium]|nr:hypothetical protein [Candidatus Babeliales bacterium]
MIKLLQNLLIASCIIASQPSLAAWPMSLDHKKFDLYLAKARIKLEETNIQLQLEQRLSGTINKGQDYADILYARQKKAIKDILEEIKVTQDNQSDEILSNYIKSHIYNSWKREFKNSYENAMQNNDIDAWNWVYRSVSFPIEE